jgi:hypothetical protein
VDQNGQGAGDVSPLSGLFSFLESGASLAPVGLWTNRTLPLGKVRVGGENEAAGAAAATALAFD